MMRMKNPEREAQGGDVEGDVPIDITQGEALRVAKASFDPGYELGKSNEYGSAADLRQGFTGYGIAVGDAAPKGT